MGARLQTYPQLKQLLIDDGLQHLLCLVEQLLGFSSNGFVVENLRVATVRVLSTKLPHLEEGRPVNVWDDIIDVTAAFRVNARTRNWNRRFSHKVNQKSLLVSSFERQEATLVETSVELFAKLLVQIHDILNEFFFERSVNQRRNDNDALRRVEHVNDRGLWRCVLRGNPHRCVHFGGCCAANQEWNFQSTVLHLFGNVDHLVKRRRNEAWDTEGNIYVETICTQYASRHRDETHLKGQ